MSDPNVYDLDKDGMSVRTFTALSSQTPDPSRSRPEGDIYEVEDPENLPTASKGQKTVVLADEEDEDSEHVYVWVAQSDDERYTGLSGKSHLGDRGGMLFDWGEFGMHGLTMRDMDFPIDMVFLDEKGRVQLTYENVSPHDDSTYSAACRYALELSSGTVERLGIGKGTRAYIAETAEQEKSDPDVVELDDGENPEGIPDEAEYLPEGEEAPEGARTFTGPQGGTYMIRPDADEESDSNRNPEGGGADEEFEDLKPEDRNAEIGSDAHPALWERPDEGELGMYVEEMQSTEWWSEGHETFEKAFSGGQTTENEYTQEDPDTGEVQWDPEREEKHRDWAREKLNEDAATEEGEQPVGMVLLGPPGAGKGWWQDQVEEGEYGEDLDGREFTQISSDRTKEPIPEYNGTNAAEVHDEASKIASEELAPAAFEDEHNVIVDKVAASPETTVEMVEEMREQGYDIRANFIDVPPEKSVHNATGRYAVEGRFVPLDYTAEARDKSMNSFETVIDEADIPEEKTGIFDNDVEWGEAPEPVDVGEELLRSLAKWFGTDAFDGFIDTGDVGGSDDRPPGRGRRSKRDSGVDGSGLRGGDSRGPENGRVNEPTVVDLDKQEIPDEAVHFDDPSQVPDGARTITGPQGGSYYVPPGEGDGAEQDEGSEEGNTSDPAEMAQNLDVSEWPEDHTIFSVQDVKDVIGELTERGDEEIMQTTLEEQGGIEDRVTQSGHRHTDNVTQFRPDATEEVFAHEFGHAILANNGMTVPDTGNMFAHFYAQQVPDFEEGQTVPEVAENMLEARRERRGDVSDGLEQKLDEIQDRYEGVEMSREDAHITFVGEGAPYENPEEVPDELHTLAEELNRAWDRMLDAEEGEKEDYVVGKPYSATNPHETMAMTHEMMQAGVAVPKALENLYNRHPGLLTAYTDLFEPRDTQKEMLNNLFDHFGENEAFDETPYPEVQDED